jgi:hypothetical protein
MVESTFPVAARSIQERTTTCIRVESITFTITALWVRALAPRLSEFFADGWVLESAVILPGAMASGIEFANVSFFVLRTGI